MIAMGKDGDHAKFALTFFSLCSNTDTRIGEEPLKSFVKTGPSIESRTGQFLSVSIGTSELFSLI